MSMYGVTLRSDEATHYPIVPRRGPAGSSRRLRCTSFDTCNEAVTWLSLRTGLLNP